MLREHYRFFRRLHWVADLLSVIGAYALSRWYGAGIPWREAIHEPALLFATAFTTLAVAFDSRPCEYRLRSLFFNVKTIAQRWVLALFGTAFILFLFPGFIPDGRSCITFVMLGFFCLGMVRIGVALCLRSWRRSGRSYRNALLVGTGSLAKQMAESILAHPERGVRVTGFLDCDDPPRLWRYRDIPVRGTLADLTQLLKCEQIDYLVFCLDPQSLATQGRILASCMQMGVKTIIATDWFRHLSPARPQPVEFFGHPGIALEAAPRFSYEVAFKSLADRLGALLGLALAAPVMLGVALAVRLSSPGPAFFSQMRLGLNGRQFRMWKFRTMVEDADHLKDTIRHCNEMSGPAFKMTNDPRVTKIGRWLRRMSIDELPQLFNVLKGDMSLVGPRPPLPDEVKQYSSWHRRRLSVKPGLTCLWQVAGRNDIDFDEWMRLDLQYIDTRSIQKDAEILARTIPAVLKGSGAR